MDKERPLHTDVNKSLKTNKSLHIDVFNSIMLFNQEKWRGDLQLPFFLRYEALKAVEESGINNIKNYYCFFQGKKIQGRANLYLVDTDLSTFDKKLRNVRSAIKEWYPDFLTLKTLECGHFCAIGEGLYLSDNTRYKHVLSLLAETMDDLASETKADFLMIRDIPIKQYKKYNFVLKKYGYYPTLGFPNTEINIRWDSFKGYLHSFKSHKRVNLKHILNVFKNQNEVAYQFITDYDKYSPNMAELWGNIRERSESYQRETLDEKYFNAVHNHLKDSSEVLIFKKGDKILTFFLCLFDQHTYHIENYGTDYSEPEHYNLSLYKAGLLLCIKRAIEAGKKKILLGITTYYPKLNLGAEITPLVYFVKHAKNPEYSQTLAKMFYDDIIQPDTTIHRSVKDRKINRINLQRLSIKIRKDQYDLPDNDLFLKADKYQRMNSLRLAKIYNLYPKFISAQQSSVKMKECDRIVLLGTNSYLGAANMESVKEAAIKAIEKYGTGCSGSPLLNGTLDIHIELEDRLAKFFNREAVVLCSTGYQTNLAGISALADARDALVMDERCHRSLFDGAKMSGSNYYIYKHNNMEHLEWILTKLRNKSKLIVTDSVFSMEGVIADLKRICELASEYNARLYVDESHAVGVFGARGRGICELLDVEHDVDIIMGTFSKSFASIGGFIGAKREIIDFIKHTGSPHVFSASLPPSAIASILAVLDIIETQPELRKEVLDKASFMAKRLTEMGYTVRSGQTQIVPVVFGNEVLSMAAYKKFMEDGVYVNPILPPAVPEYDSGFRTSYIATHKWEDLEYALEVFKKNRKAFDMIK